MTVALDFGAGNYKLYHAGGGVIVPAHAAAPRGQNIQTGDGLTQQHPPLLIESAGWRIYTGRDAHRWGRPIENLSDTRWLTGAPETQALMYAAITQARVNGAFDVIVGLPQQALTADNATQTARGLRAWLSTDHAWMSTNGDGKQHHDVYIGEVRVTTQTAGALFDYLLDEQGRFRGERANAYRNEVGVISCGMNTIELQVTVGSDLQPALSASITAGVRRMLELADPNGLYSRGELDDQLRAGRLEAHQARRMWESEVIGHIERVWGSTWKRFAAIIAVGGGATMLRSGLLTLFQGRVDVAPDPVLAVARGLYKLALLQERRA